MKKLLDGIMYISIVILAVVLGIIVFRNYSARTIPGVTDVIVDPKPVRDIVFPSMNDKYVPLAGENAFKVSLTVAGDLVIHSGLNVQAYDEAKDTYDYSSLFVDSSKIFADSDYSVACLDTTLPDTKEYTGYPLFATPASLATALKNAGIDLLSTAGNHSLDAYNGGLRHTLDVLDNNAVAHVGTYRTQEERDENSGVTLVDVGGVKIAFLAYTYGTNGSQMYGSDFCLNVYHEDYQNGTGEIKYDMMSADIEAAKSMQADIIAVFMHWGTEYETQPNDEQNRLAEFLFYEGADIILGGHPHVLEPMEMRELVDKDGNKKTGFIIYSLGNFVSCQNDPLTNLTAILNIEITKDPDSGLSWVSGAGYTPMFMVDVEDYGLSSGEIGRHYGLWNLHRVIDEYDSGSKGIVNDALYSALVTGLDDIHEILGKENDLYYLRGEEGSN